MNEERYLFRGKRLDNGEWVEGYYTVDTYIPENGNAYLSASISKKPSHPYHLEIYEVDQATVGQYTGLKDKNGKQIFDGDILMVCLDPEVCTGVVGYDERIGGFIIKFKENKCVTFMDIYIGGKRSEGNVWVRCVGNIHDNPELLEDDE